MKHTLYISIVLILACAYACDRRPSRLEQALALSGDNRTELEKVLSHYSTDAADHLKYRAACTLIENLPGKYTLDTMSVAVNQPYFDAVAALRKSQGTYNNEDIRRVCDSVKERLGTVVRPQPKYTQDLKTVTSQFLIRHIDRSFESRHASPWADSISFDTFCRYILPYKTKTHYWEASQEYFKAIYATLPDSIAGMYATGIYINSDIQRSALHGGTFFSEYYPFLQPMTFRNLIESRLGTCVDICCASIDALHAKSIPAALNIIPSWGNAQDSHFLCEPVDRPVPARYDNVQRLESMPKDELIMDMFWSARPLTPSQDIPSQVNLTVTRTVPKIFREDYVIQYENLAFKHEKEEIPNIFKNPYLKDITSQYLVCSDVTVSLNKPEVSRNIAYLCCYHPDRVTLAPVDWAPVKHNRATFRNVGVNVLYFPAYYINGRMIPAGTPFVLRSEGECQYMTPLQETHETAVLYTKFPYRSYILRYANLMLNGRFQTANRPDLSDTVTLHVVRKTPFYEQTVPITQSPPARYAIYRFAGMENSDIAEMEFWGINEQGKEEKLEGKPIGNPGTYTNGRTQALDGDRVSYFSAQRGEAPYIGLDFGRPRQITRIKYNPRSDDNGIVPGELYELYFWNKTGWSSLGKQEGRPDGTLLYTNVPKNALLNLHNHTRGKENRPFTYENGKQVWW
jgi:hypothetical protein